MPRAHTFNGTDAEGFGIICSRSVAFGVQPTELDATLRTTKRTAVARARSHSTAPLLPHTDMVDYVRAPGAPVANDSGGDEVAVPLGDNSRRDDDSSRPPSPPLAELAEKHGLRRISVRPPLREYLQQIWRFRQFTYFMSTSRAYAQNQNSYLGQLWAIITPILNALVYVIVFGLVLGTGRGLDNVVAFIVVGIFMFRFFQQSVIAGGKSVSERLQLVRSLHFPRAILPISAVITELTPLLPALAVMCGITLLSGFMP